MQPMDFSPGTDERNELVFPQTRALLDACECHPDFTVVGLMPRHRTGNQHEEAIIVECDNRQVPARNEVGISPVEQLKLVYNNVSDLPYDVRALRSDFPLLNHQNAIPIGTPVSLCLYEAPWAHISRRWTPQRFLDRILWWLSRASMKVLHEPTQPLEPLFYDGTFDLVLPTDFLKNWVLPGKAFGLEKVHHGRRATFRIVEPGPEASPDATLAPLVVRVAPVEHPPLSRQPTSLGTLAEKFSNWGTSLEGPLRDVVRAHCQSAGAGQGQDSNAGTKVILVLLVPRSEGRDRVDVLACVVLSNIAELGMALGVLVRAPGQSIAYLDPSEQLTGTQQLGDGSWKGFTIEAVSIRHGLERSGAQRMSDIDPDHADFQGVIAGYGALGSAMHRLFDRNGWGRWALVDDDEVAPHNLTRHIAFDSEIGLPKVQVGVNHARATYPSQSLPTALIGRINGTDNQIAEVVAGADLLIDATADVGSARDIAAASHNTRSVSTFLTPSGQSAVMLLEDADRQCRLLSLEAQYYRAVLQSPWGDAHLDSRGSLRTGTSCRDLSFVLPNELVDLHAATLAFHLRSAVRQSNARIGLWTQHPQTGAVDHVEVPIESVHFAQTGRWTIGWDAGIERKLRNLRAAALPSETGGIVLGITDTYSRRLQIVDVTEAPPDSKGTPDGFVRGTEGVNDCLAEARRRTVDAVDYVGEWHSHPDGYSAAVSATDGRQLTGLAEQMAAEGLPSLMVIVGQTQFNWVLGAEAPNQV